MTRSRNVLLVLAALGAATGCKPAEEWIRDDASSLLSCDVSRMSGTWEKGHGFDEERGYLVFCLSGPVAVTTGGPGAGGHVTAWATYDCPSLAETQTLMGALFSRCENTGHGLGEPGAGAVVHPSP